MKTYIEIMILNFINKNNKSKITKKMLKKIMKKADYIIVTEESVNDVEKIKRSEKN